MIFRKVLGQKAGYEFVHRPTGNCPGSVDSGALQGLGVNSRERKKIFF